jgi:AcrR family transcriptional regulator
MRTAARRQQIIDAAASLFAEKGFHRTTTKDIAEAAQVSEGTLYNYFDSKDDLLLGIMEQLSDIPVMGDQLKDGATMEPRRFLLEMMRQRRSMIDENNAMLQSVLSEILVNPELCQRYYQELIVPAEEVLVNHIEAWLDRGQLRPVSTYHMAHILLGLMMGLFVMEVLGDAMIQQDWEELSQLVTSLFIEGAAPRA